MSSVSGRDFAIRIFSDFRDLLFSTIDIEIDDLAFKENIISVDWSESIIDLVGFDSSVNEIGLDIYINFETEAFKDADGSFCTVYEITDSTEFWFNLQGFDFVKNPKFNEVRMVYSGRVNESTIEMNKISLKLDFNHDNNFESQLQIFDKNTYGQYAIFKAEIDETEEFIINPHVSPDSLIPVGRFKGIDTPELNPGGIVGDSVIFSTGLALLDSEVTSVTPTSPKNINVLFRDFVQNSNSLVEFRYGGRRMPIGQLVHARQYNDGTHIGYDSFYALDPSNVPSDLTVPPFSVLNINTGDKKQFSKFLYLIFYRIPEEEVAHLDFPTDGVTTIDVNEFAKLVIAHGKLAPIAYKCDYWFTRKHTSPVPPPPNEDFGRSFVSFHCIGAINLIDQFTSNTPNDQLFQRTGPDHVNSVGAFNSAPGVEGVNIGMYDETSGAYAAREAIDPNMFPNDSAHRTMLPGEIQGGKWMVALVPGYRVVKSIRVDPLAFQGLITDDGTVPIAGPGVFQYGNLLNMRVDAIRLDTGFEFLLNYLDDTATLEQDFVQHENIFNLATGQFAYINQIQPFVRDPASLTAPGRLYHKIVFYSSREQQSRLGINSVPNTMSFPTTEKVDAPILLISYRSPPENSADEGAVIPIVYGYVSKMPILQTISKKHNYLQLGFAGDDIYTVCAHPISRRDNNSIEIWWGLDQFAQAVDPYLNPELHSGTVENFFDYARGNWIPNPFPPYALAPQEIEFTGSGAAALAATSNRLWLGEPNPLHYLIEMEDNNNNVHTGIKLRGDDYSFGLGIEDIRYALAKNGLGSQKLFVSFVGMPDDIFGTYTGVPHAPITHPAHIIKHLLYNYTTLINEFELIDTDSFNRVFSQTPELYLGLWLIDTVNFWDIIKQIAEHTFIYTIYDEGKFYLRHLNLRSDQQSLFDFNFAVNMENTSGSRFFQGITEFVFRYEYYFANDSWLRTVKLNKDNNIYCREALRHSGTNKIMEVNFPYYFRSGPVNRVIPTYLDFYTKKRTMVEFDSPIDEYTSKLNHMDIVTITYPQVYNYANGSMGLVKEKFIIIGKKKERSIIKFTAIQLSGDPTSDAALKGGGRIIPGGGL